MTQVTRIKLSFNLSHQFKIRSWSLVSQRESVKERLGVSWRTHTRRQSTETKPEFYGEFAKNFQKCFSYKEG